MVAAIWPNAAISVAVCLCLHVCVVRRIWLHEAGLCLCGTMNSVASSVCSRHDPDVLRHEVAARKRHVEQLRREMSSMESEMASTQHGLRALSLYVL